MLRKTDQGLNIVRLVKFIFAILLVIYLGYIFYKTVFGRTPTSDYEYMLDVFWSYRNVLETGSEVMAKQIAGNYLMLIPLGFILPWILDGLVNPKKILVITVIAGVFTTCTIEVLQLVLKRGLFEFDDIIDNTIGTILGYMGYRIIKYVGRSYINKKNENSKRGRTGGDIRRSST